MFKKVSRSKAHSDINHNEPAKPAQICTTKEHITTSVVTPSFEFSFMKTKLGV